MTMRECRKPYDSGSGPTRWMWMNLKRWHAKQERTYSLQSRRTPGYTYLFDTSLAVALAPEWLSECKLSKNFLRRAQETKCLKTLSLSSQERSDFMLASLMLIYMHSDDWPSMSSFSPESEYWFTASCFRSIGCTISSILERVSATTLFLPYIWRMSALNCAIRLRCWNCLGEQ